MKRLRYVLFALLTLCLLFQTATPVSAKGEEYTYTIRFFAGRQGTFSNGGEAIVIENCHYGERVNFYQSLVKLNDNSKYYVRGIRESGKDNSESTQASSFLVTGDQDYVIAYGILGDATSYTINYVDSEGNTLAPSETYYGNVGDQPVVAYVYIEGWQPQAYNLGKTLVADASQNVFTFIYSPIPTVTNTNTVVVPGQTPAVQPPAAAPPAQGGVTVVEGEEEPGEEPVAPVEPVGEDVGDENPPLAEPEPYEDLDNEDTPLGNFDGESETTGGSSILDDIATPLAFFPGPVRVGALAVLIALAGGLVWVLVARRKRKKEDEQ